MLEISSRRGRALAACVGLVVACLIVRAAPAMALGKLQGRIVGTDTGEPIGFADILLIPADTTMRKVGGMSNADGTFLLEAAPGTLHAPDPRDLVRDRSGSRGSRSRTGSSAAVRTWRSRPTRSSSRRSSSRREARAEHRELDAGGAQEGAWRWATR